MPGELQVMNQRRQIIKFDPTFNTGHIVQIGVIVAGMFFAYTGLKEGQAIQAKDQLTLKAQVDSDRLAVKESLTELKGDLRELQRTVNAMNATVAGMKGKP